MTCDGFRVICPEIAGTLYQIMAGIHEVFAACDLPYWAIGGTALGLERHRGLIPWDDDGDLALSPSASRRLVQDPALLAEVRDRFSSLGLKISAYDLHFVGYKVFPAALRTGRTPMKEGSSEFLFPAVDLFCTEISKVDPNKIVIQTGSTGYDLYGRVCFRPDEIAALVKRRMGPIWVTSIADNSGMLDREYGSDWRDHAYLIMDHRTNQFHAASAIELHQQLLNTDPSTWPPDVIQELYARARTEGLTRLTDFRPPLYLACSDIAIELEPAY